GRIGEIDLVVAAYDDVVRSIQPLALPLVGQDFRFAFQTCADDAPGAAFTGVQTACDVVGISIGAVGIVAKACHPLARNPGGDALVRDVTKDQDIFFRRPGRPFGKDQARSDLLDFDIAEVLRPGGYSKDDQKGPKEKHASILANPLLRPPYLIIGT